MERLPYRQELDTGKSSGIRTLSPLSIVRFARGIRYVTSAVVMKITCHWSLGYRGINAKHCSVPHPGALCDRQPFAQNVCKDGPLQGRQRKSARKCLLIMEHRFSLVRISGKLSQDPGNIA
jgi:hypothetical protein